jgi:hypothetical protein
LRGAKKTTNKKNTIDEEYIAPGLRGAKKTNKKKDTDDGDIGPGFGGAKNT